MSKTFQSKENFSTSYFIFTWKMDLILKFIVTVCFCFLIFDSAHAFHPEIDGGKFVQVRTSKHRVRREVRSVTFEIEDKDYHFNFEPSKRHVYSSDIPVWLVKSKPGSSPNYTYERVPNTEGILSNGHFYVDNAKKAVAFVHYDEENRDIIYDGLFGENEKQHLIESLSESQKYQLQRLRLQGNHVIHKTQGRSSYHVSPAEEKKRSKRFVNLLKEKSEKPLDVLYPKLLILVDNHLFKYHNSDIAAIVRYVVTFWNKVDQKYTELDSVDVQLLITGIIIADDETAFDYVHKSRFESEDSDERVDAHSMFEYMRMYFHHNFSGDVDFQNYDTVVLMTALDTGAIGGFTYIGKICGDWYNGIVIRDEGWFGSIHTAAHELAHALGVEHDSFNRPGECQSRDGNKGISLMSPLVENADYSYWSDCSKRYLKEFTTVKAAECLATRRRERHYGEENTW